MPKSSSARVARRLDAKSAQLAAKRARSENAHADAIAYCDANKVKGAERAGAIAFASTAMHEGSDRGALAKALLSPGKARTVSFADLCKAAKVSRAACNRSNLEYIRHNVEFRGDLVGFVVSFDMSAETVSVRPYKAAAAAPRKAKASKASPAPEAPAASPSAS